VINRLVAALPKQGPAREIGQGIFLLAITGSSVGGFVGMLALATRALGR
jgi:hypothetical protein